MSFLLDDIDPSVMEAALSLVDEFAGDALSARDQFTASTRQTSQEDCVQAQLARRNQVNERKKMLRAAGVYGNSNHVRNNRRIEIAYLKEQLEKLQIDLEILKKQKGEDKTRTRTRAARATPSPRQASPPQQPTAPAIVATNTPTMTTVWENIADSQRRRRKKAECENIRLKMVIEHQQKVADNLRNLIQKRASQLGAECSFFTDVNYTNHHVLDLQGDVGEFQ
ncbi:hypothetical protein L917_13760, partial [Phytophthora nicotianae]